MSEEELVTAFTEGRLTRRAFVRQLVDRGMTMADALAYAERLVPEARAAAPAPPPNLATQPARPVQSDGLEISFVGDGYVVYQPARDRMHSLNNTAALVLELCTGENDVAEIARLLQGAFELPAPPLTETQQCLDALFAEGLIG
jgi:hypothetical protein